MEYKKFLRLFFGKNEEDCHFASHEGGGVEADCQMAYVCEYLTEGSQAGKIYLGNAFSLQMVDPTAIVMVMECAPEEVPEAATSIIGHADTAAVVGNILGREVPFNRASVHINSGDTLYVAQVTGGRLPEGATELPEGMTIGFRKVVVRS